MLSDNCRSAQYIQITYDQIFKLLMIRSNFERKSPFEGRRFFLSNVQYQPAKAPANTSCMVIMKLVQHPDTKPSRITKTRLFARTTCSTCPKASTKKIPQNIPKRLSSWKAEAIVVGPYLALINFLF